MHLWSKRSNEERNKISSERSFTNARFPDQAGLVRALGVVAAQYIKQKDALNVTRIGDKRW